MLKHCLLFILLFNVTTSSSGQVSAEDNIFNQVWSKEISREIVNYKIEQALSIEDGEYHRYDTYAAIAASSGDITAVLYKSTDPNFKYGLILVFYDAVRNFSVLRYEGEEARTFIAKMNEFLDTARVEKVKSCHDLYSNMERFEYLRLMALLPTFSGTVSGVDGLA